MPEGSVIQPAHLLALSLLALGASTLHGVRSSTVIAPGAVPMTLRSLAPGGTARAAVLANAREREEHACAEARSRDRDGPGCADP